MAGAYCYSAVEFSGLGRWSRLSSPSHDGGGLRWRGFGDGKIEWEKHAGDGEKRGASGKAGDEGEEIVAIVEKFDEEGAGHGAGGPGKIDEVERASPAGAVCETVLINPCA